MLQTAKVLQGSTFTPSFVPMMPRELRNSKQRRPAITTGIDRTGDAKLWKLHDEFCCEYAKLKKLDTREANAGSGLKASASARRAFKKWEDQLSVTDALARRIASSRAFTLDGMLMKIQVAGSVFDWVGKSYEHRSYTAHEGLWVPNPRPLSPHSDEDLLIVSLRADLLRLQARGGAR